MKLNLLEKALKNNCNETLNNYNYTFKIQADKERKNKSFLRKFASNCWLMAKFYFCVMVAIFPVAIFAKTDNYWWLLLCIVTIPLTVTLLNHVFRNHRFE